MSIRYTIIFLITASTALAQNELTTPSGEFLKITADTVQNNGSIRIDNGILKLNNYKFLSTAGDRNIFIGNSGNATLTGRGNTFIGASSGLAITAGNFNTFIGGRTGQANTTGSYNDFLGYASGLENLDGSFNLFVGNSSGNQNLSGSYNVFLGNETGSLNQTGSYNTYVGRSAGSLSTSGNQNTYIGYGAGGNDNVNGTGNVFIGLGAGENETGDNKLYISTINTETSLFYGDFSAAWLKINGRVGTGTSNFPILIDTTGGTANTSSYKLFVKGGLLTEHVTIASGWADYVFDDNYNLKHLFDVERYIRENGHLPGYPNARQVEKSGLNLGEMTRIQQEKIEELTLYAINRQKEIAAQKKIITDQEIELQSIRAEVKNLMK